MVKQVAVKMEPRWFVECPKCKSEHDVDSYEASEITCNECGEKFFYDNTDLDKAEVV